MRPAAAHAIETGFRTGNAPLAAIARHADRTANSEDAARSRAEDEPLPLKGINLTHEHEDTARGRNGRTRGSEVQVLRILVVEDESDIGIALPSGLAADGNAVDVVGDGRAALDWAETYPCELVVLDIVLPGMDGRDGPRIPGDSLAGADSPGIHDSGRRWPR